MYFRFWLVLLAMPLACSAQQAPVVQWYRWYESPPGFGGRIQCVIETPDGGFLAGGDGVRVIKTDSLGNVEWSQRYYGGWNTLNSVVMATDGDYVFAGAAGDDFFAVKIHINGDTVWTRHIPFGTSAVAWSVAETESHDLLLSGEVMVVNNVFVQDFALARLNSAGEVLWTRTYACGGALQRGFISPVDEAGFIIAGTSAWNSDTLQNGFYAMRIDSIGDTLWTRTYRGTLQCFCEGIQKTPWNAWIMAGMRGFNGSWIGDQIDVFVVAIDGQGDTLWTNSFGGVAVQRGSGLAIDREGNIIVTGLSGTDSLLSCFSYLAKVSQVGDTVWTAQYDPSWTLNRYWSECVLQTRDGGYIVGGGAGYLATISWYMLMKFSQETHQSIYLETRTRTPSLLWRVSPNPFNSVTEIRFDLPKAEQVKLAVFDVLGKEVGVLQDGMLAAGNHAVRFDGSALPSGIYFARLEAGTEVRTQKMMLLK